MPHADATPSDASLHRPFRDMIRCDRAKLVEVRDSSCGHTWTQGALKLNPGFCSANQIVKECSD